MATTAAKMLVRCWLLLLPSLVAGFNVQTRRGWLAGAASLVVLPSPPASAGLLDEYGTDPKKIESKPKVEEQVVPKTGSKGEAGIDPTLRACT